MVGNNSTQRNEMKRNKNARLNKFPKSIRTTDNDNNDNDNGNDNEDDDDVDDAQQLVSGWHTKPFRLLGREGDDKLTNSYYKFV